MNPVIRQVAEKRLIGKADTMVLSEKHKIGQLWRTFMPKKHLIPHPKNKSHIAIQIYNDHNPEHNSFEIWAAIEVLKIDDIPTGMADVKIPSGDYAIFRLKGMDIGKLYTEIMTKWLPSSGYAIDNRPHFQVMGDRYINGSTLSEEDVYVPIKHVT